MLDATRAWVYTEILTRRQFLPAVVVFYKTKEDIKMKLLVLLLVVAFTAYVVNAKPRPLGADEKESINDDLIKKSMLKRTKRQSGTGYAQAKKDFDSMLKRLTLEVAQQGVNFCEGDWEKGIQCFEEDLCVPWEGICDGTQVCGIEKREDCVNSTKANDREVQEGTERENCDGDEYEYMCPMKNYIPQKCGENYQLEAGEFLTVEYPFYDNGMDCFWRIKAADGQQVVANFKKFETETNYDFLSLGTGTEEVPNTDDQYIVYKHSGAELPDPPEFKVESNEVWLRFTSDDWDRKGGFEVEFTDSSTKAEAPVLESPFNKEKNTSCGEEINLEADEEIVITSPGFPQYYPNYFECVWKVKAPKGRHIGVGFEYFSLEKGSDFLEIGDGTTVGDGTVDKLTGSKIPTRAVTSPSNNAWIKFTSDIASNRLGFKAKVRDQPYNGCGGQLTVPRDGSIVIASPLFPDLGYNVNLDCLWTIEGDPERGLTIVFKEFSTEQNFDTMSAGFGPEPSRDGSNYVISAHSGRDLPDPPEFGTSSNSAWVHFKTDSERIDRGFKLEVYDSAVKESETIVATREPQELDYDCGDRLKFELTEGRIRIKSPGYPRRYRPLLDCTWTIDFGYGANTVATFDSFSTEPLRDILSLGLGKDPEADGAEVLLDMVSGSSIPDPITLNATRYIWLRFLTDFANERSGWSIEIATIPTSSCGGFFNVPLNGSIVLSSPGFPSNYPSDMICRYTINGPNGNRLHIGIPEFNTARLDDVVSIGEGCRERDPDSILVVDEYSGAYPPNPRKYLPRSSAIWMAFKVRGLGNRNQGWLITFSDSKIQAEPRLDDMGMPIQCEDLAPTEAPAPITPTPYPTEEGGSGWFPYWYDLVETSGDAGTGEGGNGGAGGGNTVTTDYPDFL